MNVYTLVDLVGNPLQRLPLQPDQPQPIPSLNKFEASDALVAVSDISVERMPASVKLPTGITDANAVEIGTSRVFTESNLFEGDLKLPSDKILRSYAQAGGRVLGVRSTTTDPDALWPGRKVYYTYNSALPYSLAKIIRQAMDHWEDNTCLRFFARNSESDYIEFRNDDVGCYSDSIGRDGGKQIINLGSGCEYFGIAVHEVGHAIGKWHEQTRPDRDQFVTINFNNIQSGKGGNFQLRNNDLSDPLSVDYDYGKQNY